MAVRRAHRPDFLSLLSGFDFSPILLFKRPSSRGHGELGKRACALAALRASASATPPSGFAVPPRNKTIRRSFLAPPQKASALGLASMRPTRLRVRREKKGAEKEKKNMIEEIKAGQTNQEQSKKKVGSTQDGAGVTVLDAISELLGSKKIPPLGAVQMSTLLQYLFNAADPPLRFQVAEIVYRHDHDHPNAQDLFLACTLPLAEKAARRKAEKLFGQPSDWQVELMYDGAVSAAIEMFQHNPPASPIPNAFPGYVVAALHRGMLRSCFMREENSRSCQVGDPRGVRTRKTVPRNTVEREIIMRELLDQVTNYANLRPVVRATLQCIAALGPDFALKEHAYTASGDPDRWKRDRDRRPILDPDAIAGAMEISRRDVHRYLCQARVILRQAFNADGRLFEIR